MSDPSGRSLGQQYDQEIHQPPQDTVVRRPVSSGDAPAASLGALYSRADGEESSLDIFSGTVMLEPRLVDTRSARAIRQAAGITPRVGDDRAVESAASTPAVPNVGSHSERGADAQIARSSAIMAAGTLVSRVLGLARTFMLVAALGLVSKKSNQANAANIWATANTLPNMVYLLIAGGVFNAVLIPQLTRALKDPDGGKAYTDRLVTLAFLILGGITAFCLVFAYPLYRLYDPTGNSDVVHLGWLFSLICLPQIMFYGVFTIFGEVLNSRSKFGAPMWTPALANLASIGGLVYFIQHFAPQIAPGNWTTQMVLVLGGSTTLGVVAQALALIIPMRRSGYRYTPNVHFRGVGLRSTSKVAGLAFAAVLVQQGGLLVTTVVLNSNSGAYGGIFVQGTSLLLFMLPHSLVTISLITALYTRISTAAHRDDTAAVTGDIATAVRLCGVAVIPVTIGAFVLVPPAAVLLGRDSGQIGITALSTTTIVMMLGSFPLAVNVIMQRTLYAYEDAKRPLLMQVLGTAVTIPLTLLCLLLPGQRVIVGVALVQTVSFCVQAGAGYYWLRRRLGGLPMPGVPRTYGRLAVAAGAAALVAFAVRAVVENVVSGQSTSALAGLLMGSIVFLGSYLLVARLLRVNEIEALLAPITSRLSRSNRSAA